MLDIRRSEDRGHAQHGWLDSHHTFSFAEYYDPRYLGFATLRVINEDRVLPGSGFPTHSHRDMEIISYVLEGALEHKDSMGNGSVIRPGDVQRMSAGRGVSHSEFNASNTQAVHFLQIWILPKSRGIAPGYEQKTFATPDKEGRLCLIASPDGRAGSVTLHQDAYVYATQLRTADRLQYAPATGRQLYLHVARGRLSVNGEPLSAGDGVAIRDEQQIELSNGEGAEALLFDL